MTTNTSQEITQPTVRQRRLAAMVRGVRLDQGWSLDELAARLGATPAEVDALENAEKQLVWQDLHTLFEDAAVPHDQQAHYLELLTDDAGQRVDDQPGWDQLFWTDLVQTAPPWKRMYVGLNQFADSKRMFQTSVIPGVFQIPEYAAGIAMHVLRAGKPELKEAVTARVSRAGRLTDPDHPLTAHAILTEGALRLGVCSKGAMRRQYDHVLTLMELPNVTVQVLPFNAAAAASVPAPFIMLGYNRPAGNAGIVYLEHLTRTRFLDRPREIRDYKTAWETLEDAALSPGQSADFIRAVRDEA